jgi:hypothetical protein
MNSKNDVLTYFLMYFCQNFSHGTTLPTPLLLLSFIAITDHPKAGEVPPGCDP